VIVPPILTRAAFVDSRGMLTREASLLLDALRGAVGGNSAEVSPVSPLGALTPVALAVTAADTLAPVSVSGAAADLSPVALGCSDAGLSPVTPA